MTSANTRRPRRAEAATLIEAPARTVWQAMLDFDAYAQWNPFIVRIGRQSGSVPEVGECLLLHVRFGGGWSVRTREQITTLEHPAGDGDSVRARLEYEFLGPLHNLRLVRGRRLQTLEQHASGATTYHTEETFHGMLAFGVPLAGVRDGFRRHALALKARAESMHRADPSHPGEPPR